MALGSFPEQPWSDLDAHTARRPQATAAATTAVSDLFAAPRDFDRVADWLRDRCPGGTLLIAGAGTHTAAVLPVLKTLSRVKIPGLTDRDAAHIGERFGYPVFTPEQAAGLNCDFVLLSQTCREDDMRQALLRAGFPTEKILSIYGSTTYRDQMRARDADNGLAAEVRPKPFCIIRAGRSVVVDDANLTRLFPPDQTADLFIGRAEYRETGRIFRQADLQQSLDRLAVYLDRLQPRVIYLSTGWFNNFLMPVVRRLAPKAFLIHEVFDWNLLFPKGTTTTNFGHEQTTIMRNLLAEYQSGQLADAVVSKRDGVFRSRVAARFKAPYLSYFSGTRKPPAAAQTTPATETQRRLVYGGILPAPRFLKSYNVDYDFLPLFETLCNRADGRFSVDIFNSLHHPETGGEEFAAYAAKYAQGRLRYAPRLDYEAFLKRLGNYDYGWQAVVARGTFTPDQCCVLPNRAIGYLAAGLPLITDPGWELLAAWTTRFNAGLVLRDFQPEQVAQSLLQADRASHRAGAVKLAHHLQDHNDQTLDELAEHIAKTAENADF